MTDDTVLHTLGARCVIDCHYRRLSADGEFQVFESTDGTRSNWDPEIQHGSPPLALMTKLIEELAGDSGLRVGRLTLDILGAIPVTPVRVRAWVERPGARISMMAAEMLAPRPDGSRAGGRPGDRVAARDQRHRRRRDRPLSATRRRRCRSRCRTAGRAPTGYLETVSWRRQRTAEGESIGGLAEPAGAAGGFGADDGAAAAGDGGRFAPTAPAPRWTPRSSFS